jgi:biofilm protein TabA
MIIDRLEYADRYVALHPQFGAAFRFLRQFDPETAVAGKHSLSSDEESSADEPFLIIEQTEGRGIEASRVEYHRRYIDIQYVAAGTEVIGWMPTGQCQQPSGEFDPDRDIGFFEDTPQTWLTVPEGCFAIFFPADGHAPLAGTGAVHKVVVKIPQSPERILGDLIEELRVAVQLHPEQADKIRASVTEVEQAIEERTTTSMGLGDRLRELAQELEVTHPRLTHTVGRVADALGQIGI